MASTKEKKRNALINYFEASYQEIRKVAWPTRNQATRLTFLVLGFVVAVAILIGVLDFVFGLGHSALLDIAPERALPVIEETQPINAGTPAITIEDSEGIVVSEPITVVGEETPVVPEESTPTDL